MFKIGRNKFKMFKILVRISSKCSKSGGKVQNVQNRAGDFPSGAQIELQWTSNGAQMEVKWSRGLVSNDPGERERDVLLSMMYNI